MRSLVTAALMLLGLTTGAGAETFPTKPVKIIVAFPAGGATDIVARLVGQKLTELWGQQVIIDNRGGAAGVIGTELAAAAPPDGYTLFMGTLGNLAVNQHLYPKMRVDPARDFAPITQVVDVAFALMAHPSFPPNDVAALITLARAKPDAINYSSSGAGGAPHLAGELFKSMAKVSIAHVPYKGSGPSMQDLLAGQVQMTFDSIIQGLPHLKEGKIKMLAVLGATRAKLLPEVPTVAESGLPGYALGNWFGLVAPAATPSDIVAKIATDVIRVLQPADVRASFAAIGAEVVGSTPAEFGAVMRADSAKWAQVIKDADIKAE